MLVNKVAQSGLVVLDLEEYYPSTSVMELDISSFLLQGLVLREKDFRLALRSYDWNKFKDKFIALYCSTDAIVPQWAYMLVTSYLQPVASDVFFGNAQHVEEDILINNLNTINIDSFRDERVIIKGCGKLQRAARRMSTSVNYYYRS